MFDKILLPLDGSATAEAIIPQVRRLLRHENAQVLILRVVSLPIFPANLDLTAYTKAYVDEATTYTRRMEEALTREGMRAWCLIGEGSEAATILDVAEREKAALIAMSTHGYTGLARWVFGSVTLKVLRRSPIPLLVVRSFRPDEAGQPAPVPAEELPFRNILLPTDGSEVSLRIVPHVIELAHRFGSKVNLLRVVEPHMPGAPTTREVSEHLHAVADRFQSTGIEAATQIRTGHAAAEILEACRSLPADLIAMTRHGRSGVPHWLYGSVTEKVLNAAPVPMLVVR